MNDEAARQGRPDTNAITCLDDSTGTGPPLVIAIGIEGRPRVRQVAGSESEERRLQFWVKSQPRLHRLVYDAVQLMREAA